MPKRTGKASSGEDLMRLYAVKKMVNSCSASFLSRTRGNGLQLCHEGFGLPIDGRKNLLAVTALKHCNRLQGDMTISLEFFKKSD